VKRGPAEERAPRLIALSFLVSALGSAGLGIVYLAGGHTQAEGLMVGIAFGGLAFGLVAWSKYLMPDGPFVEERDSLSSEDHEREKVAADFARGGRQIGRRRFLGWSLAAAMGALGVAMLFPVRSLGSRPGRDLFETAWADGIRLVTSDGEPVRADELAVGTLLSVFPEGRTNDADAQAVLVRLRIDRRTGGRPGAQAPEDLVAYSKICTHAGCLVGLYDPRSQNLLCPCHQGAFDAADGARPIAGPVTRRLPELPLRVDGQGFLRAAGDFPEPVGVGFWNRGRS